MNPAVLAEKGVVPADGALSSSSSTSAASPSHEADPQSSEQKQQGQGEQYEKVNEAATAAARHEVAPETRFFRYFQQELTALMNQIDKLEHKSEIGGERNDAIDHCLAGISRLSKEVKEASSYVPSYHQKIYADAIKALQDKLTETRAKLAPRPKFAFKSVRKRPSAMSLRDLEELNEQHARGIANKGETASTLSTSVTAADLDGKDSTAEKNNASIIINGRKNAYVSSPTSSTALNQSVPAYITDIESSVIDLSKHDGNSTSSHLATLSARGVQDSILICGRVTGAAHITGAENTVVVVGCQQLRLHECRNIDVYLSCGSRPIIEDSTGVRVARIPEIYRSQFSTQGTDLWDQVQDFNWIKTEASPNWRLLDDSSIPPLRFWERIGTMEVEHSLEEVLKTKMAAQN